MEATQAELDAYNKSTEVPSTLLLGLKWSAVDYTAPLSQNCGLHNTLFAAKIVFFVLWIRWSRQAVTQKAKIYILKKKKNLDI